MDEVLIRRVLATYADIVSRRAWPELEQIFTADAPITVDTRIGEPHQFTGPIEVGNFIAGALEAFSFFEFVILNAVVLGEDGADTAHSRMWMQELRQSVSTGQHTIAYGVYQDTMVRVDGSWRFAKRQYHSMARTSASPQARDLDVFTFPGAPPDWGTAPS